MKKCPMCKSKNVTLYMGGIFGKFRCKDCTYLGPMIIEEDQLVFYISDFTIFNYEKRHNILKFVSCSYYYYHYVN